MQIYSQNVSGAASKIHNINQFLATTHYDIICLQETWFDDASNVDDCTASTSFSYIRNDRSSTLNKRKKGGGLVTFIRNELDYEEIRMTQKFLVEVQIFRVVVPSGAP